MENRFRAVVYARCSTEEESQKDALITQEQEAIKCVESKGWTLIDRYVESKSGTTVKGRDQYQRLYEELLADKFDIIVIKSQDRLMRNVKDWYLFLDRMIAGGKRLYMYLEGHFYSADDSLITGIKAILAEEYSRELSKKINNAHRNRQETGKNIVITSKTYGYDKIDKKVVVNKEEAVIVRRMFELCVQGYGSRSIKNILHNEGYRNRKGKAITESVIRKVIRNPIHMGTVVMNKCHYDFTSKRVIAVPESEWIYHRDAVPPIVPEKLWKEANRIMDDRTMVTEQGVIGKHKGSYHLSGKLRCGSCGQPYYRTSRRVGREKRQIYEWKCAAYLAHGKNKSTRRSETIQKTSLQEKIGCDNISLEEERLITLLHEKWEDAYKGDYGELINHALGLLKRALMGMNQGDKLHKLEQEAADISRQSEVLLDKLIKEVISDEIYTGKKNKLDEKLRNTQFQIEELAGRMNDVQKVEQRMEKIEAAIRSGNFLKRIFSIDMIEKIEHIDVYWDHLDIFLDMNQFRIELGTSFCREKRIENQQKMIMEYMRSNPSATALKMAEELGMKPSIVHYRIQALRNKGQVSYSGKGGHGQWEVKKE